jgi:dihydroneopterin aldolase
MPGTITIDLKQLHFHAYHGHYPEEKILGNDFVVDLSVSFIPQNGTITGIHDTVNYTELYSIVKDAMKEPVELLETLAMNIITAVHLQFPQTNKATIHIQKLHPPIISFQGNVGVSYTKEF